jgi:hypothetical protein
LERVLLTLTAAESKRLIGKAIANLPEVQQAYRDGIVFIATSTSTAYVVEELLHDAMAEKGLFTAGVVVPRGLCLTAETKRHRYIGVRNGVAEPATRQEMIAKWLPAMGPDDVFIKGVNAIDPTGVAAILLGNAQGGGSGGTIATAIGTLYTRGAHLILAAGLEKLVPCALIDVAPYVGGDFKYAAGLPSGMMPVQGTLVTELQAFESLTGVEATPIAAGGIGGAEGCHTFILEGTDEEVEEAWTLFKTIKGEPSLHTATENCDACERGCHFNVDEDLIALRRTRPSLA